MGRLPRRLFLGNLRPFRWLFALTYLIHIVYTEGSVVCTVPLLHLRISLGGVIQGTVYSLRLGSFVLLSALMTSTTSPMDLADALGRGTKALRKLRLPVQDLSMMLALALRLVPTVVLEADRIQKAQAARGANFEGNLVRRFRSLVALLIPLFVSAFRRADELALAMEARCYSGGPGRTSYRVLHWSRSDTGLVLASVGFLLGCVFG